MLELSSLKDIVEAAPVENEFLIIKPKEGMSLSDAGDFVKEHFKKEYYDDNGNVFRKGNELIPNNKFEKNGYTFTTDSVGRTSSAEGNLHLKEHEGRQVMKDSIEDIGKGDQREGDDRGHLIADQFDGPSGLENLVPQDAGINRVDYRNFENELRSAKESGNDVHVKVEPIYKDDSHRPDQIVVTYRINGEESMRMFPNGR